MSRSTCSPTRRPAALWLISASLEPRSQVFDNKLIPQRRAPDNYVEVWHAVPLWTARKSFVLTGFGRSDLVM